jgi:hypothetical protein
MPATTEDSVRKSFLPYQRELWWLYHDSGMAFPIKVCAVCGEEFELKPNKPGFANRCPACSEPEPATPLTKQGMDADDARL